MLLMPSKDGYSVNIVTDKVRKNGTRIEKEMLCTISKERAEAKAKELEEQGYEVKIYECIF